MQNSCPITELAAALRCAAIKKKGQSSSQVYNRTQSKSYRRDLIRDMQAVSRRSLLSFQRL